MNQETLDKIKADLEAEQKRLESELGIVADKDPTVANNYAARFPDYGNDEDENANEVAEYSDRLAIEHTLESELKDVKKALQSFADGTYGICKHCGLEIEEARLKIRPTSTSHVDCKKKLQGQI